MAQGHRLEAQALERTEQWRFDMDHTPTVPISRPDLIAALCGDTVCRHCAGRGKVFVANERAGRPCPMCSGTGLTTRPAPQPKPATYRRPQPAPGPF